MNEQFVGTTSTGIKLYTNALTKAAENYAKSLKLKKIRIFIAERENKSKRYIVVWNGDVIYETPLYEQIGARLDVLKITRKS